MKEIHKTVYETFDGKTFDSKSEAEAYEYELNNIRTFKVYYYPDLNEGRGFQEEGYILVHSKDYHMMFAEEWCYKKFGNRITFVMGTYGSNAITHCWLLYPCGIGEVKDDKILVKLEENFVDKIWN